MEQNITFWRRFLSVIIDSIILWVVLFVFALPGIFFYYKIQPDFSSIVSGSYFMYIAVAVILSKDSIGGQSIAKRIFHFQVVRINTGEPANPYRCILRNLLLVIWPVEILLVLFLSSRRIGDFVAGTELVRCDAEVKKEPPDRRQIVFSFLITYVSLLLLLVLPLEVSNRYGKNKISTLDHFEIQAPCYTDISCTIEVEGLIDLRNSHSNEQLFSFRIREKDIGKIDTGMKVVINSDSAVQGRCSATIEYISPTSILEDNALFFLLKAGVTPGENYSMGAGDRVSGEIVISEKENVLAVNVNAIQGSMDHQARVEVKRAPGKFESVPVVTGISDGINVEIVSGLSISDSIRVFK